MALILLAGPAVEPITLAEAKLYLRVEHADDDALIGSLITAARAHVETRIRRALITQTWRIVRDAWPRDGRITLPIAPLRQVVAARAFDGEGIAEPIDAEEFVVDVAAGVIGLGPWALPVPGRAVGGIEIDVELGYGPTAADVPQPLRQATRFLLAHWYDNRGLVGAPAPGTLFATVDQLLAPYRILSL